jgi:hypothetical protein
LNGLQLDVGHVEVVVDDVVAERLAGDRAGREAVARHLQGGRHARLVGLVGVALERWLELQARRRSRAAPRR